VDYDPAGTNTHINIMDIHGNRHPVKIIIPSADPDIDMDRLENLIAAHEIIALNVNPYCRKTIPIIRKYHQDIWCDLGDYETGNRYFDDFYEAASFVTMSGIHIKDQRSLLEKMISDGKKLAVITNGKEGSIALTESGELIETEAVTAYPRVDTNGAGDSFFAGLLYGHVNGHSVRQSVRMATIVAGLTVSSTELFSRDLSPAKLQAEYQKHYGDD
jgi:sugar/nucleoside kinase (ribokinase family)